MSEHLAQQESNRFEDATSSTQSASGANSQEAKSREYEEREEPPKRFTGDLEGNTDSAAQGDELSRYESSANASRALSRLVTGSDKLIEEANNTDEPLPKMGGGRDYPPPISDKERYIVSFDGPDDPTNPQNWPLLKKVWTSLIVAMSALSISLGSAMFSEATAVVSELFHVGLTVSTLATSLFVFGFASGPVIWGPLSELYGRRAVMVPSALGYVCFSFAVATAKDLQTIMLCRFFAGFVGAAPIVVAPASMADMFTAGVRGQAMAVFASVLFGGPMLAPIFGGFTVKNSSLGWRWTSYFSAIVGCLALVLVVFFYEETHHPMVLRNKAEKLRRRTGNWAILAPAEEVSMNIKEIAEKTLIRPIFMLFTEPILFLITIYNSFIYGLLYLLLTAVPLIFQGRYGWSSGVGELPYLSMLIGVLIGGGICIFFEGRYNRVMIANGGKPVPEERLPPIMVGSFLFCGGLFWLGWSGDFGNKVHWIVPTIGASFVGIGLMTIFLPSINYIIDCYLLFAASALAGNTFLRSIFGGVFPLFARQMFVNMHIKYAATVLGCVAAALIPVPFLFYIYGEKIRGFSKYAFVL
ncbi:Piso0_004348 [Millerozyma farinosa CBS 7064]|uniref:Piso0_004348 protein n=1 Tax=Pichia sorbitophila (strain ATCC MYA-4447 / BCRC 22081 / CBS 7064 / NBRC 10061 / NRRL Y-12695) TaxID=559304 RepID=G8Y862_PICSO|nr:Piso0_004348 [Millerozyma farinosa CBS 7064]CCE84792.1 Piso0_004348 [Millerozyma farinosa CBS 7064]